MAHPLTQHPSSSLPFSFPPRPSPLSFGFGHPPSHPSPSPSFGSPARPALAQWPTFGQTQTPSRPAPSPSRPKVGSYSAAQSSLKRTRRSRSPSGSPPPSPTPPTGGASTSPSHSAIGGSAQKGSDAPGQGVGQRQIKRSRLHAGQTEQAGDGEVDIGIMLATLPPSAHLPILLQLLRANPSLSSSVLAQIPQPDLRSCNAELDRIAAQISKAAGPVFPSMGFPGGLADARRWERVRGDVDLFCRTATTYIRYITSPTQKSVITDLSSLFSFLQPLTQHLLLILALIPSSSPSTPSQGTPASPTPATTSVLDLAKLILSTWTEWVTSLSTDVNQKGGMHPHSIVSHWAETLDQLAAPAPPPAVNSVFSQPASTHWSSSSWGNPAQGQAQGEAALVVSFREAVGNVRDQFVGQVGWLIGRQRQVV
ncbi:hypothetical protein IAT38_004787 [Cryptococcus sp. DSM 104549]